jgi:hypothetical protein
MMKAERRRLPFSISVDKIAAYPESFSTSQVEKVVPVESLFGIAVQRKPHEEFPRLKSVFATHPVEISAPPSYTRRPNQCPPKV